MATWPPIASNATQTRDAAVQPFTGEAPIITDSAASTADIVYLQLCALLPAGTITPYVVADHTKDMACVAAVTAVSGKQVPYYKSGNFNHEAMTWPASLNTLAKRKGFCIGTQINPGHLLP